MDRYKKYNMSEMDLPVRKKDRGRRIFIIGLVIIFAVGLGIGILIGHFGISSNDGKRNDPDAQNGEPQKIHNTAANTKANTVPNTTPKTTPNTSQNPPQTSSQSSVPTQSSVYQNLLQDENPEIGDILMGNISSENIRENLRMLSSMPHIAGKQRNHELAIDLTNFWTDHGLDYVALTPYDVLLSYPNMSNLNYVELLDANGTEVYKSNLTEPILTPEENKTGVVPPFNAYSAAGDVKGVLVYVNYGRVEDYVTLENASINVTGKIALARYGKIFRGDKVHLAESHGAIGIIIFSDPADYTGGDRNDVYPRDWWLPPSGTQRGTISGDGDPLTPGYPAIATAYRQRLNESDHYVPGIPSHPIGYGIALKLMEEMAGEEVPNEWRGGMNVTYRFGGSFKTPGWYRSVFCLVLHFK